MIPKKEIPVEKWDSTDTAGQGRGTWNSGWKRHRTSQLCPLPTVIPRFWSHRAQGEPFHLEESPSQAPTGPRDVGMRWLGPTSTSLQGMFGKNGGFLCCHPSVSGTCACNRWASRDWGGRAWKGRGKEKGAIHDLGTMAISRETGRKTSLQFIHKP